MYKKNILNILLITVFITTASLTAMQQGNLRRRPNAQQNLNQAFASLVADKQLNRKEASLIDRDDYAEHARQECCANIQACCGIVTFGCIAYGIKYFIID